MKRLLPLLLLPLLAPSAFAEKKSPELYWSETGLSTEAMLKRINLLKQENCYSEKNAFKGCAAAINAVAAMAEPAMQLVPANLTHDPSMKLGATVKSFGPFALVKVAEEKGAAGESLRVTWERGEAQRKKKDSALESLFRSTRKQPADFERIFTEVARASLKDNSKDAMAAAGAISAYLAQAVDAHARIEPIAQLQDSLADADESFTGIGATLQSLNGKTIVMNVLDGSPALASGVKPNDVISHVDENAVEGKKLDEVVKLIRGPEGSRVTLKVQRKGSTVSIPITRGRITLENVEAKIVEDLGEKIGLIKLRSFMDNKACPQISAKITELERKGAKGLIFDLRGNGGGLLQQSVCIGGLFLGRKLVVKVKDLQSDSFEDLVSRESQATRLPMVTLIDAGSASASEILSGALQDYQRSWVLGERSFGKGTVQAPTSFYNREIVMFRTIQRFYQPTGRTNQMVGISPDIEVPVRPDASADELFRLREADIYPNGLEAVGPVWKQARPKEVKKISSCLISGAEAKRRYDEAKAQDAAVDYQLLTAQETLRCAR